MRTIESSFARDGFIGPVRLLRLGEYRELLKHLSTMRCTASVLQRKQIALRDEVLSALAADRRLLGMLTPLLGPDIVLWGSQVARRTPDQVHLWHVDIETSSQNGKFVTVWIGLENTNKASGLQVIAGSHLCGKTVQQFAADNRHTQSASTRRVLDWARSGNSEARLVCPDVGDGDAIFFDGRLWHGSHNRSDSTRIALLLHYASADSLIRTPPKGHFTWPFKYLEEPPPVLLVQGTPASTANPVVPFPRRQLRNPKPLRPSICNLRLPLREKLNRRWQPFPLIRGATRAVASMSCHASVLSGGHSPHPPHAHDDEELLIVLDGEAELLVANRPDYEGAKAVHVSTGDFAYYPAQQHHTLRNPGGSPVSYLMFRWRGRTALGQNFLRPTVVRAPVRAGSAAGESFIVRRVLDAPTRWLRKLHCHTTRLEVGAGYAPHADPYDVAILVQSGVVKTLGREVGRGNLIYYPAGELHGMRNVGDEVAHYIVFEFHGLPLDV
jgi:mannose-6-phosphate isomerase-like protein (cupin superfamily)